VLRSEGTIGWNPKEYDGTERCQFMISYSENGMKGRRSHAKIDDKWKRKYMRHDWKKSLEKKKHIYQSAG